jgi:predicted nucleotidyltransferase
MTLLQQMESQRSRAREALRQQTRQRLREALRELAPADEVTIFGSLSKPGRYTETSDVDIALTNEPAGMSIYQLTSLLAERLGRPVDVVILAECRFRDRILREGETWTLRA